MSHPSFITNHAYQRAIAATFAYCFLVWLAPHDLLAQTDNQAIRLQRIFVPEEQIGKVATRDYMPISVDELEQLIESSRQSREFAKDEAPLLLATQLIAQLEGERLVSQFSSWRLRYTNDMPGFFHVAPLSLACGRVELTTNSTQSYPWEQAEFFVDPLRRPLIPVDQSGEFAFAWTAQGNRGARGELKFDFRLPAAPLNRMLLRLPTGMTISQCSGVARKLITSQIMSATFAAPPAIEKTSPNPDSVAVDDSLLTELRKMAEYFPKSPTEQMGIVDESSTGIDSRGIWLIEFGGNDRLTLEISPTQSNSEKKWSQVVNAASESYRLTESGLELESRIELTRDPLQSNLNLFVEPPLRVREVRIDGQLANWTQTGDPVGSLQVALATSSNAVSAFQIQITSIAPRRDGKLESLPHVLLSNALLLQGNATLKLDQSLAPISLISNDCDIERFRETSDPASDRDANWRWKWTGIHPRIEVTSAPAMRRAQVSSLTRLTIVNGAIGAASRTHLRPHQDQQNQTIMALEREWILDALSSPNATGFRYESAVVDGQSIITIQWEAIPNGQLLEMDMQAHRALETTGALETNGETVQLPSMLLSRFEQADHDQTFVIEPAGRFLVEPTVDLLRLRVSEDQLENWQRERLPRFGDAWLLRTSSEALPPVSFSTQPATFSAQLETQVTQISNALEERYKIRCRPLSGALDRLTIRTSQARSNPLVWSWNDGTNTLTLQSIREIPEDGGGEVYQIILPKPFTEMLELQAVRQTPYEDSMVLSLPAADQASSQESVVQLDYFLELVGESNGVQALPRSADNGNQFSSKSYRIESLGSEQLRVSQVTPADSPQAWAQNAEHHHWLFANGDVIHQSKWDLQSIPRSSLKVRIPASCKLLAVEYAEQNLKLNDLERRTEIDSELYVLDLPDNRQASKLMVRYSSSGESLRWYNQRKLPHARLESGTLQESQFLWLDPHRVLFQWPKNPWRSSNDSLSANRTRVWNWLFGSSQSLTPSSPFIAMEQENQYDLVPATKAERRVDDSQFSWRKGEQPNLSIAGKLTRSRQQMELSTNTWHCVPIEPTSTLAEKDEGDNPSTVTSIVVLDLRVLRSWAIVASLIFLICTLSLWKLSWRFTALLQVAATGGLFTLSPLYSTICFAAAILLAVGGLMRLVAIGKERLKVREPASGMYFSRSLRTISRGTAGVLLLVACSSQAIAQDKEEVFGVIIPYDKSGEIPGQYVYVPVNAYNKLIETTQQRPGSNIAHAFRGVEYKLRLYQSNSAMAGATSQLTAEFELDIRDTTTSIVWPIGSSSARLERLSVNQQDIIPGFTVRQDAESIRWQPDRNGPVKIKLFLIPNATSDAGQSRLALKTLPIPTAKLEVTGDDLSNVRIANGPRLQASTDSSRLLSNLGPIGELAVTWRSNNSLSTPMSQVVLASDSWIHLGSEEVIGVTQLRLSSTVDVPSELDLLMDSRWEPIGRNWQDGTWLGSETAQAQGLTSYRVNVSSPTRGAATIRTAWRVKQPEQLPDSWSIPFVTASGGQVSNRTCAFSSNLDSRWDVPGVEQWEIQSEENVAAIWGKFQLNTSQQVRKTSSMTDVLLAQKRTPPAKSMIDELCEVHVHRDHFVIEYESTWLNNAPNANLIELVVPKDSRVMQLSVDGRETASQQAVVDDNGERLSVLLEPSASPPQTLFARIIVPLRSDQSTPLPRVLLADTLVRSCLYRLFRDIALNCQIAHEETLLPLVETIKRPSNETLSLLESAEFEADLTDLFRESPSIPSRVSMTADAKAMLRGRLLSRLEKIGSGWRVLLQAEVGPASSPVDMIFLELPASLTGDISVEPEMPFRRELSPDGSHQLLILLPTTPISSDISFQLSANFPEMAQTLIAMPEIRLLNSSEIEQWIALPKRLAENELFWEVQGMRPSASPPESKDDLDQWQFFVVTSIRHQATLQALSKNRTAGSVRRLEHQLKLNGNYQWSGISEAWVEPAGNLLTRFRVPEPMQIIGARVNGTSAEFSLTNTGECIVRLRPSDLASRIELAYTFEQGAKSSTALPSKSIEEGYDLLLPMVADLPVVETVVRTEFQPSNFQWNVANGEYVLQANNDMQCAKERMLLLNELLAKTLEIVGSRPRQEIANWFVPWQQAAARDLPIIEYELANPLNAKDASSNPASDRTTVVTEYEEILTEYRRLESLFLGLVSDETIERPQPTAVSSELPTQFWGSSSSPIRAAQQSIWSVDGAINSIRIQGTKELLMPDIPGRIAIAACALIMLLIFALPSSIRTFLVGWFTARPFAIAICFAALAAIAIPNQWIAIALLGFAAPLALVQWLRTSQRNRPRALRPSTITRQTASR